jgi:hypothetical protein
MYTASVFSTHVIVAGTATATATAFNSAAQLLVTESTMPI